MATQGAPPAPIGLRWATIVALPPAPQPIKKGFAQTFLKKPSRCCITHREAGSILAIRLHTPWHKSLLAARVVVLR